MVGDISDLILLHSVSWASVVRWLWRVSVTSSLVTVVGLHSAVGPRPRADSAVSSV